MAAGRPERLPVRLALDGVDEALTVFLHRMHSRGHPADLDVPLVLRADDAEAAWTVQPPARGAEPVVLREALDGADVVEAPAGVLLKVLWKRARPTDAAVRISGDERRVGRFLASRLTP